MHVGALPVVITRQTENGKTYWGDRPDYFLDPDYPTEKIQDISVTATYPDIAFTGSVHSARTHAQTHTDARTHRARTHARTRMQERTSAGTHMCTHKVHPDMGTSGAQVSVTVIL